MSTQPLTLEKLQEVMAKLPPPIKETTARCGWLVYERLMRVCVPRQTVTGIPLISGFHIEYHPGMPSHRVEMGYYEKGNWVVTKVCDEGL